MEKLVSMENGNYLPTDLEVDHDGPMVSWSAIKDEHGSDIALLVDIGRTIGESSDFYARAIPAAFNSYSKNCTNTIAAAESDLLGEALELLDKAMTFINCADPFYHEHEQALLTDKTLPCGRKRLIKSIEKVLEQAKG